MLFSMLEKKLQELAPVTQGLQGDLWGLQVGSRIRDFSCHKIVIALDPTVETIEYAIEIGAQLLITHHGLTHRSMKSFNDDFLTLATPLIENRLGLFVIHTAWDAAKGGISETLCRYAGLNISDSLFFDDHGRKKPIGRFAEPINTQQSLRIIAQNLKKNLNLDQIILLGNENTVPKKIGVVGGKGLEYDMIASLMEQGCDTFLTGEYSYPEFLTAQKMGLNLIGTSHYKSEKIGMESLAKILRLEFPRDEFLFYETPDPVQYMHL